MIYDGQTLKKVSRLVAFFAGRDPRYRVKLRSWEDFRQIPSSRREDLRDFFEKGLLSNPFNITATSGSTASRLVIAHSREAYEAHVQRMIRIFRQGGARRGALFLNLCSYGLGSGGRMMEAVLKAAGAGVIPLGPVSTPDKLKQAVRLIQQLKPTVVNAYTNQLFDLLTALGRKHSVTRCLVTGEALWPEYRRRMEEIGGVKIYERYGATEISGLAITLKPDDEYMKVISDGLLLEVLDGSGNPSWTGKGSLLVTDTDNRCMPFIRYHLGDHVELVRRRGSLWIKVLARTQDSLLINGVVIWKRELIRVVNECLGHPCFFFIINKDPVTYQDKLIVNMTKDNGDGKKGIEIRIARAVGLDCCVDIRQHQGAVPRTETGKMKYFIDLRRGIDGPKTPNN